MHTNKTVDTFFLRTAYTQNKTEQFFEKNVQTTSF